MNVFFENKKLASKNFNMSIFSSFIVSLIVILIMLYIYNMKYESVVESYSIEQDTSIKITELFINDKLESVYSRMMILLNSKEIDDYVNNPQDEENLKNVEKLFYSYAEEFVGLTQIRILDVNGMEKIRINNTKEGIEKVSKDELQEKSQRYYFTESMKMNEKEMYISDFDLNVEHGRIVVPYEPTIRFAVKLNSNKNEEKGILIINVDGLEFLKVIRQYEKIDDSYKEIGILDSNNYWSLDGDVNKNLSEIALIMKDNTNDEIRKLFEDIFKESAYGQGTFEYDNIHYSYYKIRSTENEKFVFDNKEFSWYVVGYYELGKLIDKSQFILKNIIPITLFYSTLAGIIFFIIMMLYILDNFF